MFFCRLDKQISTFHLHLMILIWIFILQQFNQVSEEPCGIGVRHEFVHSACHSSEIYKTFLHFQTRVTSISLDQSLGFQRSVSFPAGRTPEEHCASDAGACKDQKYSGTAVHNCLACTRSVSFGQTSLIDVQEAKDLVPQRRLVCHSPCLPEAPCQEIKTKRITIHFS